VSAASDSDLLSGQRLVTVIELASSAARDDVPVGGTWAEVLGQTRRARAAARR
jgi:hypothetical protein